MKRRYLYLVLFSVPIVLASAIVAFAVFGAAAGIVWLFLAGDTPGRPVPTPSSEPCSCWPWQLRR